MDLRKFDLTPSQVERAARHLNYQPFVITDDVQTGVAYSWLHHAEGGRRVYDRREFVFDRRLETPEVWSKAVDANRRLATMYDEFLDEIAARHPGASLADMACNNGYFVFGAALRGMKPVSGFDHGDYAETFKLLTEITGVEATFRQSHYNSWTHRVDDFDVHDVVVVSQIMQHIPDPLYFLSFVASRARKALLLFTGMGNTDALQVYYQKPNRFYPDTKFPVNFDNDVGLSRGLLYTSLDQLGFDEIKEIEWKDSWLPKSWFGHQKVLLCSRVSRPYFHHHRTVA